MQPPFVPEAISLLPVKGLPRARTAGQAGLGAASVAKAVAIAPCCRKYLKYMALIGVGPVSPRLGGYSITVIQMFPRLTA